MIKAILLVTLLALSNCYTEEGKVLVLQDKDFPSVISEFSHILIEFYAPWCGHCKSLAPVYTEVAAELHERGSIVRLAKVDATVHSKAGETYKVEGYPTLIFFYNGEQVAYNGPRTKDGMINWLEKRTRDPLTLITSQEYSALAEKPGVSVVYHGDIETSKNAQILKSLAIADDYNTYYYGTSLGHEEGTVEVIRPFDSPVTRRNVDGDLKAWLHKHDRPLVVTFDDRTIGEMFSTGKRGIVLFNGDSNSVLLDAFTQASKQYEGESIIFTEIDASNEHLENLAQYIKLDKKAYPIVIIEARAQTKYVLKEEPTKQNILQFLANFENFKYGLNDEVVAPETPQAEETQENPEEL